MCFWKVLTLISRKTFGEFKIFYQNTLTLHVCYSLLSLESLLSSAIEAETFILVPARSQRAILRDVLSVSDQLIDSIISSVQNVSQIPTGELLVSGPDPRIQRRRRVW